MKTNFLMTLALVGGLVAGQSQCSFAQGSTPPRGYWVVQTNERTRDHSLVQFYDLDDQLVYEERLEGVNLDVNRRKTARLLDQILRRITDKTLLKAQLGLSNPSFSAHLAKKRD